jgi:RNA polymerase sigma-70 factor (ECF subfamily)
MHFAILEEKLLPTMNTRAGEIRSLHVRASHPEADASDFSDECALVAGIRRGQAAAATALFLRYRLLVERTLVRILGFDSELQDAVQETFIRALDSTRLLRDPKALPGWLVRISVCTASDLIRRRKRRWWLHALAPSGEQAETASTLMWEAEPDLEARRALQAAYAILAGLPTEERIAMALRRLEGMELKEVADACGCSLATIKRRLARAEGRFQSRVRGYPALERWLADQRGGTP